MEGKSLSKHSRKAGTVLGNKRVCYTIEDKWGALGLGEGQVGCKEKHLWILIISS